jgi:hypothetical protein
MQSITHADLPLSKLPRTVPSRTQVVSGVSGTLPISDAVSLVSVNAASAVTMQLPDATQRAGHVVTVIKNDSSANAVTVSPFVTGQLGGATSISLAKQYAAMTFVSDGSNWLMEGRQWNRTSATGNGSTTAFTLNANNNAIGTEIVSVAGVIQDPSTYTATQTQITFGAAPANSAKILFWAQT